MFKSILSSRFRPNLGRGSSFICAALSLLLAGPALPAAPKAMNADLAIVLPAQHNIKISAQDVVAPLSEPLLPRDLLAQVENAYLDTPVGDALRSENTYGDWMLVSVRIAPCSPLGIIPNADTQIYCWPEVRLVWQPVLKDFRRYAVILNAFADDRAIHALYDFRPELALPKSSAARAEALLSKIRAALDSSPAAPAKNLSADDLKEFIALRDQTSNTLVQRALGLRSGQYPEQAYLAIDERPEFNSPETALEFISKLKNFIAETAPRSALKEMTSFSLPEGREPPQADDWIFLQFLRKRGGMEQQNIKLHSAKDGRVLFDFGTAPRASQMRDEPELHTALETMNGKDAAEVRQRVLLSPRELSEKSKLISDRSLTLVPNTSCASCHKLNNLRFDFHAFSYLEDRTISVSPRVRTDVLRDLQWLEQRAGR